MTKQETYDSWEDCLGRTYRPGDIVGVAVMAYGGRPEQVVGVVLQINKTTKDGKPIMSAGWKNTPSCSVKVRPLHRGTRHGVNSAEDQRAQTYSCPDRIVLVKRQTLEAGTLDEVRDDFAAMLEDLERG